MHQGVSSVRGQREGSGEDVVSFTCTSCGYHYFYSSNIQGGRYLDMVPWAVVWCLKCGEKYLYSIDVGFRNFDPEIVP